MAQSFDRPSGSSGNILELREFLRLACAGMPPGSIGFVL